MPGRYGLFQIQPLEARAQIEIGMGKAPIADPADSHLVPVSHFHPSQFRSICQQQEFGSSQIRTAGQSFLYGGTAAQEFFQGSLTPTPHGQPFLPGDAAGCSREHRQACFIHSAFQGHFIFRSPIDPVIPVKGSLDHPHFLVFRPPVPIFDNQASPSQDPAALGAEQGTAPGSSSREPDGQADRKDPSAEKMHLYPFPP